jgi:hypothetical protein
MEVHLDKEAVSSIEVACPEGATDSFRLHCVKEKDCDRATNNF